MSRSYFCEQPCEIRRTRNKPATAARSWRFSGSSSAWLGVWKDHCRTKHPPSSVTPVAPPYHWRLGSRRTWPDDLAVGRFGGRLGGDQSDQRPAGTSFLADPA